MEENDYNPKEFDGELLAIKIEDLSNHKVHNIKANLYHYSLNQIIQLYRNKSNKGTDNMYTYPPNKVIAQKICKYYKEERGIIRVSPSEGYKTVSIEKLKAVPNIDEREYTQAIEYDEEYSNNKAKIAKKTKNIDDDNADDDEANENWYESLKNL